MIASPLPSHSLPSSSSVPRSLNSFPVLPFPSFKFLPSTMQYYLNPPGHECNLGTRSRLYLHSRMLCIPIAFRAEPHLTIYSFTISVGTLKQYFVILSLLCSTFMFYITVKRSAQNAGIKRESKLAKNIALLVSTNVFFFVLPVLCVCVMEMIGSQNINEVVMELLSTVFLVMWA